MHSSVQQAGKHRRMALACCQMCGCCSSLHKMGLSSGQDIMGRIQSGSALQVLQSLVSAAICTNILNSIELSAVSQASQPSQSTS